MTAIEAAGPREALRHRAFVALVAGRTISVLGNALASIAITFAVLDLTGSATDLGLVLAARTLPQALFLLFGGVVADRFPRHRVLVAASILSAATQAVAAVLLLSDQATIGWLAVLGAMNGAASAFLFPASAGLLPQTVPPALLQSANVVLRMFFTAAGILGVSLGGVLVAGVGPGWAVAADAVTFLGGALCFAAIRVAPAGDAGAEGADNVIHQLRAGWSAFRSRTWLWVVVLAFGVINAMHAAGWSTLGPTIANVTFGRQGWGFVLAAETVGAVLSGLVLLRVRFRRPLFVGMLGVLVWSPLLLVLATEPSVVVLALAALLAGAAIEVFALGWDLSMQQHVPPQLLSRVYAYDALGSLIAIPIGQALAGPASSWLGIRAAVAGCGVVIMLVGGAATCVPAERRLERLS